jgi:hypothetical protein
MKLKNMGMKSYFEKLPFFGRKGLLEDYWFEIGKKLYQERGKIPDPLEIRALAIIKALGLPSGPYSAIEIDPQTGERVNPERDRIIAEYLTNKPGVQIEKGVVSLDFRDMYPEGLPQELKEVLDPNTRAIMEIEYEHEKNVRRRLEETENEYGYKADHPVHYFRLPGGIDLFLRGYRHISQWQKEHGEYLRRINKHAKIIAVEGFVDATFGASLELLWTGTESPRGSYEDLMKDAVKSGFNGLFTEIDARDSSKVKMDRIFSDTFLTPSTPALFDDFLKNYTDFLKNYFGFLKREHPFLADIIGSPEKLGEVLMKQSTTEIGIPIRIKIIFKYGKEYFPYPYLTKKGKTSFEPTFLELGQHLFSDALAAIKLHLIAKLMADGYLEKGPIIDYEGSGHLSSKSFFLKYPQYAMEVVLRAVNELMAGRVENLPQIYEVFRNPNWPEIIKEITRLVFKKPEEDPSKPVEVGPNQRRLLDYPVDYLAIYHLNPETIMPSDEEIEKLRERLRKQGQQ